MKKYLSVILSLFIFLCMSVTVLAATGGSEVWVSSAKGNPGEMVEINISLGDFRGIASLKLGVEFDIDTLTLVDIEYSDSMPGYFQLPETYNELPVALNWHNVENIRCNCDFATLTFKINDSARDGEYPIDVGVYLKDTFGYNNLGEIHPYEFPLPYNGIVTVGDGKNDYINVTEIDLNKESEIINVGKTLELVAATEPENATNNKIEWYSSNENIAVVNSYGKVTAVGEGRAIISAFVDNVSDSCVITVRKAHEHSYLEMNTDSDYLVSKASCCDKAVYYYSCSCGKTGTEKFEYGAYADHQFGEWIIVSEATETKDGLEKRECKMCDFAAETKSIPATGHIHRVVIDKAVEPTCTQIGKSEGKHCDVCGEILIAQKEVPALGHNEIIDEAVAPTCITTGLTEGKHCSVCKTVLIKQETVKAKGHQYGEWYVIKEATDEKNGEERRDCKNCECFETRALYNYIRGDINNDGKVNNKDVTRLFQYLSGMNVSVVEKALDVNGDGKINNKDVTRLFQYLSGMDVEIY